MKNVDCKLKNMIPGIVEIRFEDWRVYLYRDFLSHLTLGNEESGFELSGEARELFTRLIKRPPVNFRTQETIATVPYLCGVFFAEKEIRLYTAKLAYELFLLHEQEIISNNDLDELNQFRKHAEKVAGLKTQNFLSVSEEVTFDQQLFSFNPKMGHHDLDFYQKIQRAEILSQEIIRKILININSYTPTIFEDLTDYGLTLTATYPLLRIHLLKFLAILPSLDHDLKGHAVKKILLESLYRFLKENRRVYRQVREGHRGAGEERAIPKPLVTLLRALYLLSKITPANLLAKTIRYSVKKMARRFIAGESMALADETLKSLYKTRRDVTLDQLGELVVSEEEADHYKNEVLNLIRGFSAYVPKGEQNAAGINRAHVSIKVSALSASFKPEAPEATYQLVAKRLKEILLAGFENDVFINIDAEHYHFRDLVLSIYKRVLLETPELNSYSQTGIVLQAYLRDASKHLDEIILLAMERKLTMPIRLVKGAYWDAETVEGEAHSFNAPQFLNKEETDIHFRQLIIKILKNYPHLKLAVASHNFSDHAFAEAVKKEAFIDLPPIEHQCLHMTYEALSTALAQMGWPTRNYVPVGSLLVGMAYLVRRIMENSSQVGVLTIMRSHKRDINLSGPVSLFEEKKEKNQIVRDTSVAKLEEDFFNIAPVRTYLKNDWQHVQDAIHNFKKNHLGKNYGNSFSLTGEWIEIRSSSDEKCLVGKIQFAQVADAEKAIALVDQSFYDLATSSPSSEKENWRTSVSYRVACIAKAAVAMLDARLELASLIIYEAGKTLAESLGDVDEAIDFLNYYARAEVHLQRNFDNLVARGPIAVIAPWNFPLAIPAGMTVSALVAGNPVILKSAEQTPLIAARLVEILHNAGVPSQVLIHLPGEGETVGDKLVKDNRIAGIVFTGSKSVGQYIYQQALKRTYKNRWSDALYPVLAITEMGGKNAVIVTDNAELDETISGILASAFSHAGQKCSALSRVIVHKTLIDKLAKRLKEAVETIVVGPAFNLDTVVNPIITRADKIRLMKAISEAKIEANKYNGQVIIDRNELEKNNESTANNLVYPAVFLLPKERALHPDSYAMKELFGPVLHLIPYGHLDEAIEIFNGTEYALTGGIFSQSQNDIDYLLSKLDAGNIYVNRTITGARVAIEPFGGYKMSGTGPKAGGRQYVKMFHQIGDQKKDDLQIWGNSLLSEDGAEAPIEWAIPSHLLHAGRLDRMDKFLTKFIGSFENYFPGISYDSKDILRDFKKWVLKNYQHFYRGNHKNRVIPGQLSYNDHTRIAPYVVVVSTLGVPPMKTWIQFLSAVLMGSGVTIIARNKSSLKWWDAIVLELKNAGFSLENIKIFHPSTQLFHECISSGIWSRIIFDGSMAEYEVQIGKFLQAASASQLDSNTIRAQFIARGNKICELPRLLTRSDAIKKTDFYYQLLNFVQLRSMAINTMRHGAPLE